MKVMIRGAAREDVRLCSEEGSGGTDRRAGKGRFVGVAGSNSAMAGFSNCRKWPRAPACRSPSRRASGRTIDGRERRPPQSRRRGAEGRSPRPFSRSGGGASRRPVLSANLAGPVGRGDQSADQRAGTDSDQSVVGRPWIESNKHRKTLVRILDALFAEKPAPTRLHRWLAGLTTPMIVDVWYDTLMADALTEQARSFVQWQGIRRSGQTYEEPWGKVYDGAGTEIPDVPAYADVLLYKPHGAVRPASNYLISDSGLCRGSDRNRYSDADSRSGDRSPFPSGLRLFRLSFRRPDAADLRPSDHQALPGPALRRHRRRTDPQ